MTNLSNTALAENGIKLTHTDGMTTIDCQRINTEENMNASIDTPLVSFTAIDIEQGQSTKYFSLEPESFGKPGNYSGLLQYRFECVPNN